MLISYALLIVVLSTILFIVFNIVSVYLHKETFTMKAIKTSDSLITWNILNQIGAEYIWWSRLKQLPNNSDSLHVIEKRDRIIIKAMLKGIKNQDELWTFMIDSNNEKSDCTLIIRKQSLTHSKIKDFINKYILNKKDIENFCTDFLKEFKKYENQK
jgi:hypothetical protein